MGVKNGANRVIAAIESIQKQSFKNWEFIICDDGSSDITYSTLLNYTSSDNRIIVLRNEETRGLPFTLNKCLSIAKGQYIARMDDDDISYSDRFKKQLDFLNSHPEFSFISSCVDIFDGTKIVKTNKKVEFPKKKNFVMNSPFVHPATMFRAQDLKKVGGYRVSKDTLRGQDYDLFMRMYAEGFFGANYQEPLYRYTESSETFKKRTFKARIGEMKIRAYGFKKMKILIWAFPFVFKPFIAYAWQKIRNK